VTIPGYYDGVTLDDDTRRIMDATPDDEPDLKRRLGIAEADRVGSNLQEALQYPSLNIRGMASADVGDKARTIIPATATAEIDIRTVPETPAAGCSTCWSATLKRRAIIWWMHSRPMMSGKGTPSSRH
jgi:acetylornithine deacetylase/succinyl-diaminopimelate desuccinylase-like protein